MSTIGEGDRGEVGRHGVVQLPAEALDCQREFDEYTHLQAQGSTQSILVLSSSPTERALGIHMRIVVRVDVSTSSVQPQAEGENSLNDLPRDGLCQSL